MNLSELQKVLPWSLKYTSRFLESQDLETHRYLMHDSMHIIKSMGQIASLAEKIDHGNPPNLSQEELADKVADLVICALHMAKTNPFGEFDLEEAVINKLEKRNGVKIRP